MQPHTPHLGPTADRISERIGLRGWDRYHVRDGQSKVNAGRSIWDLVQDGTVAHETRLQSYRESLQVGLESFERLVSAVDGKVVVSADHGEMLGERLVSFDPREFGHTTGLLTEPLRIVPWQVVQTGPRRDVVSDPPVESETLTEERDRTATACARVRRVAVRATAGLATDSAGRRYSQLSRWKWATRTSVTSVIPTITAGYAYGHDSSGRFHAPPAKFIP
jgi:hypothetical protein